MAIIVMESRTEVPLLAGQFRYGGGCIIIVSRRGGKHARIKGTINRSWEGAGEGAGECM